MKAFSQIFLSVFMSVFDTSSYIAINARQFNDFEQKDAENSMEGACGQNETYWSQESQKETLNKLPNKHVKIDNRTWTLRNIKETNCILSYKGFRSCGEPWLSMSWIDIIHKRKVIRKTIFVLQLQNRKHGWSPTSIWCTILHIFLILPVQMGTTYIPVGPIYH